MADSGKYILFKLNGQTFGVNIQQVISIERLQPITPVPRSQRFIEGVTDIRGETTAVIDLRERLQLPVQGNTEDTRILVIVLEGMQVGLIVDEATEVKDISRERIEEAPAIISGIRDTFLEGVAKVKDELILILAMEQILDFEEKNELKEVLQ